MYDTLEKAKAEIERLDEEVTKYEAERQEATTLEDKLKAFEGDIKKCEEYLAHTSAAKDKYSKAIQVTNGFIEEVEGKLKESEDERAALVAQVAAVGLSLDDVERMHRDFATRNEEIKRLDNEMEELRNTLRSRHENVQGSLQRVVGAVNAHNKSLRDLGIDESLLSRLSLELIRNPLEFVSHLDHARHGDPSAYLQGNMSLVEVESLLARSRTEALERAAELRQDALRAKDDLNRIIDLKHERDEANDNLNIRLRDLEYEYDKLHDAANDQKNVLKSKIEELSRLNRQLEMEGARAREDAEERLRHLKAELDAEKNAYEQMRHELNGEIRAMLEFLVNFKMDVQQSLAEYKFEQDRELQEIRESS
jgi:kinetochore protein NDC80